MASCEKCWEDAQGMFEPNGESAYSVLMRDRKDNPCTPEEQAGSSAGICTECNRKTLHQFVGTCMNKDCKSRNTLSEG